MGTKLNFDVSFTVTGSPIVAPVGSLICSKQISTSGFSPPETVSSARYSCEGLGLHAELRAGGRAAGVCVDGPPARSLVRESLQVEPVVEPEAELDDPEHDEEEERRDERELHERLPVLATAHARA